MSPSNPAAPARLRAPEVLAQERGHLAVRSDCALGFALGADEALHWLMTGGPGPLTGELVGLPIRSAAVVHELAAADALLPQPPGPCVAYAAGVLHALMWAQMMTPEPPHTAVMAARSPIAPV